MTDTITKNEHLSALLDDEAGAFEQRRVLDELQEDADLQRKLASWSLAGETLRGETAATPVVGSQFLAGIHQQLDAEEAYDQVLVADADTSSRPTKAAWYKPLLGGALAAGLAVALVMVGLQNPDEQPAVVADNAPAASAEAGTAPVSIAEPLVTAKVNNVERPIYIEDTDLRKRLKRYVNNHVKYGSKSAIMPSVRAIGYAANY